MGVRSCMKYALPFLELLDVLKIINHKQSFYLENLMSFLHKDYDKVSIGRDSVKVRCEPNDDILERILFTKRSELMIINSSEVGPAWAECVDILRDNGLTKLSFYPCMEPDSYEWLSKFSFVKELCLNTDVLPPREILSEFNRLTGIYAGLERTGKVKDAEVINSILNENTKWLTLAGKWKNCDSLINVESIEQLGIGGFTSDSNDFYSNFQNLKKLHITYYKGFDLSVIMSLPQLETVQLYQYPKKLEFPDLRQHPSLKTFDFDGYTRKGFDISSHFSPNVNVDLSWELSDDYLKFLEEVAK